MKQTIVAATLLALVAMAVSSQVLAEEDYQVSFKNDTSVTKYVKMLHYTCMSEPHTLDLYTVPPGKTYGPITLKDKNSGLGCVNGYKQVNWAAANYSGDATSANITFNHSKSDGWYTKIEASPSVASATCNGQDCSALGTKGVNLKQPSPIIITLH